MEMVRVSSSAIIAVGYEAATMPMKITRGTHIRLLRRPSRKGVEWLATCNIKGLITTIIIVDVGISVSDSLILLQPLN